MRHGFSGAIAAVLVAAPIVAVAQVSALPRTSDGRPNLQGIWQVLNTVAWDILGSSGPGWASQPVRASWDRTREHLDNPRRRRRDRV